MAHALSFGWQPCGGHDYPLEAYHRSQEEDEWSADPLSAYFTGSAGLVSPNSEGSPQEAACLDGKGMEEIPIVTLGMKHVDNFVRHTNVLLEELARHNCRLMEKKTFLFITAVESQDHALRRSKSDPSLLSSVSTQDDSEPRTPLGSSTASETCEVESAAVDLEEKLTCKIAAHENGTCVPCNWQRRSKGCKFGDECAYCHFEHKGHRHRPNRKSKDLLPINEANTLFSHAYATLCAEASGNCDHTTKRPRCRRGGSGGVNRR